MRFPALLTAKATARLCGFGEGRLYQVRGADPTFPDPVRVPGRIELLYRKRDVLRWIESLEVVPLDRPPIENPSANKREAGRTRVCEKSHVTGTKPGGAATLGAPREGGNVQARTGRLLESEAGERGIR